MTAYFALRVAVFGTLPYDLIVHAFLLSYKRKRIKHQRFSSFLGFNELHLKFEMIAKFLAKFK